MREALEKSLQAMLSNDVECVVFKRIGCKTSKKGNLKILSKDTIFPKISQGIYSQKEALIAIVNSEINFAVWNKLYKSNIWENIRFPENIVYEDFYIIFQIFEKINKIFLLNEIFVKHRYRNKSITLTP